jgi:hypothetical protein
MLTKKFGTIFKELLIFLLKKLSLSSQKYGIGIRDPRSGIRKKPIPDPGSSGQKGSRIPDPDPQHCLLASLPFCGAVKELEPVGTAQGNLVALLPA